MTTPTLDSDWNETIIKVVCFVLLQVRVNPPGSGRLPRVTQKQIGFSSVGMVSWKLWSFLLCCLSPPGPHSLLHGFAHFLFLLVRNLSNFNSRDILRVKKGQRHQNRSYICHRIELQLRHWLFIIKLNKTTPPLPFQRNKAKERGAKEGAWVLVWEISRLMIMDQTPRNSRCQVKRLKAPSSPAASFFNHQLTSIGSRHHKMHACSHAY